MPCQSGGPTVVLVVPIHERDNKACISNSCQREKPLRSERSRGPRNIPAYRIKPGSPSCLRAFSSCSRTNLPTGIPVLRDVSANQSANSSGTRTVSIVLLIRQNCITQLGGSQSYSFALSR